MTKYDFYIGATQSCVYTHDVETNHLTTSRVPTISYDNGTGRLTYILPGGSYNGGSSHDALWINQAAIIWLGSKGSSSYTYQ